WCIGLIGMAIKYAEALLAVRYRTTDKNGEMCGGPMHFIEKGLGSRFLAVCFALFGVCAAMGGGNMIQANSVADVMESSLSIAPWLTGVVLAAGTALTLAGGIKGIGKVASYLVPFMAILYLTGGITVLVLKADLIPAAFGMILSAAFKGQAAVGGFAGASVWAAIRLGLSRGLSSSEAGLGTASIAAAAAKTDYPGRQALVSMSGAFISTIVMCTITGLVIAVAGVLGAQKANGAVLDGASLTVAAFNSILPGSGWVVTIGLVFFAFSTILGWGYYGEKCMEYLFHERSIPYYRILFSLMVIPGATWDLDLVWRIADVTNALMAIPNLLGVLFLSRLVYTETRQFETILKKEGR
ncbi:MAG: alanine:cation symporter family protein, partial [Chlamydiia bacterium]|nr:alanine:cation symporter family protein [Chlamydiia bacterium]